MFKTWLARWRAKKEAWRADRESMKRYDWVHHTPHEWLCVHAGTPSEFLFVGTRSEAADAIRRQGPFTVERFDDEKFVIFYRALNR